MKNKQKKVLYISEPKLIKALSKPVPSRIVKCFYKNPLTASEIAEAVGFPKDKIYYHIKKLIALNILYVVESVEVKGIVQKKYLPIAGKIKFGKQPEEVKPGIQKKDEPLISRKDVKVESEILEVEKQEEISKPEKTDDNIIKEVRDEKSVDVDEDVIQEEVKNILLENLKKSRTRTMPASEDGTPAETKTSDPAVAEDEQKTKATFLRTIDDRRRSNDRRDNQERRLLEERREKQLIDYEGRERREGKERRMMENRRTDVALRRATSSDRRLENGDATRQEERDPIAQAPALKKRKRLAAMENTLIHLNGMTHTMTFVHTGENVTFMQADRGLDDYVIKQVKNYQLPYEEEGQVIDTFPELIKHVYHQSVDASKSIRQYLAYTSTDYHYEMTYMQPQTKHKDEFKDFLFYNLNKSYALNMDKTIVDWTMNDSYENNAVVCYSSSGDKIKRDYDALTASGIQPRYNTSIPKLLLNIYNNSMSEIVGGNAMLVYMDESRTYLALIQRFQLVDSRYFRIGLNNFILPLCKTFDINGNSIHITSEMALDFLRTHGIAVDDNAPEDTGPLPWNNAQALMQTSVEMLKTELVNSNSYFTNVRRTIAKKSIFIDEIYVGGPGSHIKNIVQVIGSALDKPTRSLDELYMGYTKKLTIPKQQKRLARNQKALIKQQKKTRDNLNKTKARVKELGQELNTIQNPGAMESEVERLTLGRKEKDKKLDLDQVALVAAKARLNRIQEKFKGERSGLTAELEAMADTLDQLEKNNLENYKELDLLINKVSRLKNPENPEDVQAVQKISELKSRIRELEEQQQIIIKDAKAVEVECELCNGKIRNHEKAIELTVRDELDISAELKVKIDQQDDFEQNPWRSPVTTLNLKQSMEEENVDLLRKKMELEINLTAKRTRLRDSKKRRIGLIKALTPLKKDLDREQSDLDEQSSAMVEISQACDHNEKNLAYAESEFKNSTQVHDASIESIETEINELERKNVGERAIESKQTLDELNEQKTENQLDLTRLREKFKLELEQERIKHDQMIKEKNKVERDVEENRQKILRHKKMLDQFLLDLETSHDVSNILTYLQKALQVTADILQEPFSRDLLKVEGLDRSVVGSLSTAEQTIAWSKGRLPEYREKLATRISIKKKPRKRLSPRKRKEIVIIGKILEVMDALIILPDDLQQLRKQLSEFQDLATEKHDLESKQDALQTNLENIGQERVELGQRLNSLARKAKRNDESVQKNTTRRKRERSALEITEIKIQEGTAALESLRKTQLEEKDNNNTILQGREETIDKLQIKLAGLDDVKKELLEQQSYQRKTEAGSQEIEKSIQIQRRRSLNLEDRFQNKKDDTSRKTAALINRSEQLIEEIGALEKEISDEELWLDQAKDRAADIKRQKQQWIQEKDLMIGEADTLKSQMSAHRIDVAEQKEKLQETLNKIITKSELDESLVIDAVEQEIQSSRAAMLAELQVLTDQENLTRKQLDDAIEHLKRLNTAHENINSVLEAEREKNSPIISKLNGELSDLENNLDTAQKSIHELRRELKRQQAGHDRWGRRLSDETIAVAEKVADLNASIENKKSDAYLSFVLEGLERVGDVADADATARTIIQENIEADQETIRSEKDGLGKLRVRSKDRLSELSIGIKNLEKDLEPITRKRNGLLRKIRSKKQKIDKVEKSLRNHENKVEQSAAALNDAEVNFLKFQQKSENKLADIALTRGGIQDSASVVMDKLNQELNDSIASLGAQREKMKKNCDADVQDVETELAAILDGILSRQKDIEAALASGDKAKEESQAEITAMAARKKTAMEMIRSHRRMIRVQRRDIKNIEQMIHRENKALTTAEKKFLSQLEVAEKTMAGMKEKQQTMEQDLIIRAARMNEMKKQNPGYDQDLKTLEKEIAELIKKNETLKGWQAKTENRFAAHQVRLDDQLTVLEQKRKGHEKVLDRLNKDISDLESGIEQLEKTQESHNHRLQILEQEKALAQDKLQSIVKSLERNRKQANTAKVQVEKCLQGFKRSKEMREAVIPLVESMLGATDGRMADLNKDQKAFQDGLRELEKSQKEKTASLRLLEQDLGALNRKMKDLEKAYLIREHSLQQKLTAGEVALNRIQTELAILEQERRNTIAQLKTLEAQRRFGMKAVENNEIQFRMRISALEITRDTLTEEKAQIQRSLDLITASITDLKTRIKPLLAQDDELQKSQGRLEIDINALKTELQVIGVTTQNNIKGIEKTNRVIHAEQKKLRQEEKDLKATVRDLETHLEAATKYIREQQAQLDAVTDKKTTLVQLLSDKEKELSKIEQTLEEAQNLFQDKRKLKKLIKRERTLTKDISRVGRDIDHLQENYKALNRVLTDREQTAQENVKELEDICSESELSIINSRKEIRDVERKIKSLSKKLEPGPEIIKTLEKRLQKSRDDQDQLELKLKEIERGLDLIRKKIDLMAERGTQESTPKGKQVDIDYMANMGLLLDPQARLNILPDEHKADFRFFVPNRVLQAAMLIVITVATLVTFSRRSSLNPLETALPQKTEQAATLDIKKQVYRDILNDLGILEGFHALLEGDKVMSDNIVSVLKYVSNALPSEFKVTDLAVNNNVPFHRLDKTTADMLELEKKPLMSITLSGFLQMDGDRSARVLRPFRSQLERDRQFKAALFSEQEDGTRYKTPYIIDLIL